MDLNAFARDIRELLLDNIPVESDEAFLEKHAKRGKKLFQAVAGDDNMRVVPIGLKGYAFEMGSPNLEENFPHYHILEDAFTIKKRGQGTTTSKGSQDKIADKSQRDYGAWTVNKKNGKSVYQEYRKNVRGNRKPKEKFVVVRDKETGQKVFANVSTSYVNRHYHYIEKAMDNGLPFIAQKYGMRMGRVQISDEEKQETLKSLEL